MRQDENAIEHANGTSDNMQACGFARYKADGEKVTGDEQGVKPPTIGIAGLNMRASQRPPPLAI